MADFHQQFALKTLGSINYFLGFEAHRNQHGIFLSQHKYVIDLLKKANMLHAKPCPTPMSTGKKLSKEDGPLFDQLTVYRVLLEAYSILL